MHASENLFKAEYSSLRQVACMGMTLISAVEMTARVAPKGPPQRCVLEADPQILRHVQQNRRLLSVHGPIRQKWILSFNRGSASIITSTFLKLPERWRRYKQSGCPWRSVCTLCDIVRHCRPLPDRVVLDDQRLGMRYIRLT